MQRISLFLMMLLPIAAKGSDIQSLSVNPPAVQLISNRDRATFVVQALSVDGITRDVTDEALINIANPALVKREGNRLIPAADGQTTMTIRYGEKSTVLPITVSQATTDRPISFKLDVMPVFMRAGCNAGSCHGAARGKDGFRLSLFGFDADGDYYRLTRELPGRRINLAIPQESLLMEKPAGKVPHTGGQRISEGDECYSTLLRWLSAGTPADPAGLPVPVSAELYPKQLILEGSGTKHRIIVVAKYSDGSMRDVTNLALFLSNNDVSAKVGTDGMVTAGERGEAFVMARFATFTVGSQVIVLPRNSNFTWPNIAANNYVDDLVHAKLRKLRIKPSDVCTDEAFLRRTTIDITGLLPTADEYTRFMNDPAPDKRVKLIDALLERKEFAELWVLKWAEQLQMRSNDQVSPKAMVLYFNWLQDKIARNVPVNEWVRELLSASGGTFANPATNYYLIERDRLKVTENVAQVFMGMRIQCAQCHNHPFDRWTMEDYYGFAAFFSQIGRKGAEDPRELIVFNAGGGEMRHPVGGRVMPPKFLGGEIPNVQGKDRRNVLATWLVSPDNPYFAPHLANVVWTHFFGVGVIHEPDDVRVSNPASNPELVAELGKRFVEYKYDFKQLVRDICRSRTYQLATKANDTNEADTRNFAKASIRRIRAESMLDVLLQVTETKEKFPGLPLGSRAVEIGDGARSTYFLSTFGRATRESVCSCEVKLEPTLSQSLHLLNGRTTTAKIQEGGLVKRRLTDKKPAKDIVDELYIRCLSRKPAEDEWAKLEAVLNQQKDQQKALEDVFWALLNTREFMFNH